MEWEEDFLKLSLFNSDDWIRNGGFACRWFIFESCRCASRRTVRVMVTMLVMMGQLHGTRYCSFRIHPS